METPTTLEEELVSTCRTGLGDSLRSVIVFTPDDWEVVYIRKDLEAAESELREVKAEIVENERMGFTSQETYGTLAARDDIGGSLGEYRLTIRVFDHGYLGRVIVGDHGVIATTDEMNIDAFEDIERTVGKLLAA
ncbi:hypothetical protein [Haloarchaeobius sp. HME9146]|uniref:DUF7522 family protein n=1 Tax=Haloarchaeobius sp. HME9146 TaxID=2978732 RepID=UPI0021BF68A3|nr:hypothetical protein [Haloarchaeobius sp. HME9146]MCT9097751.1 hypothetical protein [Haloarchaeobius sp. HME9146]